MLSNRDQINFFTPTDKKKKIDRFIPLRNAMDMDVSSFSLSKENSNQLPSPSPSKQQYQERLAHQMFDGKNPHEAKILAFKQKAPAPKEGHLNQFNVLFSAQASESSKMRAPRHIPSLAERILDAPNIRNDFYSNNLDWSRRNVVAIALQDTESDNDVVYLWDAGSGNISKLTTSDRVICSVKFTEDGNHLSIGKEDGSIEIWDTMTGQGVRRLIGHEGKVFHPRMEPQLPNLFRRFVGQGKI